MGIYFDPYNMNVRPKPNQVNPLVHCQGFRVVESSAIYTPTIAESTKQIRRGLQRLLVQRGPLEGDETLCLLSPTREK